MDFRKVQYRTILQETSVSVIEKLIKNIEHNTVLPLAGQVEYLPGQIVSKTLAQNRHHKRNAVRL